MIKDIDIGKELRQKRKDKKYRLEDVSKLLGISVMYLSQIERNLRKPSDELIYKIADLYDMDVKYLLNSYNRITEEMKEELNNNKALYSTLFEVSNNDKLDDARKDEIMQEIYELYKKLAKEDE
ncbi:helix-turn-helix domain-containing protein [Halobacillus karajensis]|uniref:helix-turn-helix domain-containing protein n=1 Tax=Halobacillus karajensis TaxID=195088 RepID=UPI00045D3F58|nr:helix-turn-helix transcriptional regulator [Halobacillus karajensis]CDQ21723.1 HTH-type transcriptional regulator SinR [Halobacillus karajensis]